ncbi:MarR family winged helix-turn-helix transcriptional regulator [Hoeflea poritis]|uniref:MarR family transcriptional regulator n=1 Tax=Hoeflea poritis TaxID=2993659 RepID=A0ABT4VHK3_9HYPH|nr:MarR family transcriptional regulator [Hoeflea poritis]MDA4844189.1 MarR family transcriptional regulator [Hoeflea poritis]
MPHGNNGIVEAHERRPQACLDTGLLHELLGHLLRHAFNRGQAVFADVFADDDITPLQFMILELVARNPGVNHSAICAAMGTAASVVTTTLKPLLAAGTIIGEPSPEDRRVICYRLSPEGERWFAGLRPKITDCEDRFARSLTTEQRKDLIASLKQLAELES